MDFKAFILPVATIFALITPQYAAKPENVMKTIHLDEYTPQGILHLPSEYSPKPDSKEYTCHYWITFLDEFVSTNDQIHQQDYGISVRALGLTLIGIESSIQLSNWPLVNDNGASNPVIWKSNVSSSNPSTQNKEHKTTFSNVCIKLVGNWNLSRADLLLTLYYDKKNSSYDTFCPKGMFLCGCNTKVNNDTSNEEDSKINGKRCISEDLRCNGVVNCGIGCDYDEIESISCKRQNGNYVKETCVWTDFEYLLMMVMTGFLLILIPVVFLLTMMYHRRATNIMSPEDCDGNNNVERCRDYPHIISTVPVHFDAPPSYDDLPDELKIPPRLRAEGEEPDTNT